MISNNNAQLYTLLYTCYVIHVYGLLKYLFPQNEYFKYIHKIYYPLTLTLAITLALAPSPIVLALALAPNTSKYMYILGLGFLILRSIWIGGERFGGCSFFSWHTLCYLHVCVIFVANLWDLRTYNYIHEWAAQSLELHVHVWLYFSHFNL